MKKKLVCILCAILTVLNLCCTTGFCSGDVSNAVWQIMSIRNENDGDVTLTDVRKGAASVAQEFSKDEINDILIIVNDYYNGKFADEDYYKTVCENISASDVDTAVKAVKNPEVPQKVNMGLIIGIAGGVVGVGIIALLLVVILKKKGNNSAPKPAKIEINPVQTPKVENGFSPAVPQDGPEVSTPEVDSTEETTTDWEDYF